MDTAQALLKAICENPDDDLPRLVYADYLDENGEPERARFIRIQIATTNHDVEGEYVSAIEAEANRLLIQYRSKWSGSLNKILGKRNGTVWWSRGFPYSVMLDLRELKRYASTIFAEFPIQRLQLFHPRQRDASWSNLLKSIRCLATLNTLQLGPHFMTSPMVGPRPQIAFELDLLSLPLFKSLRSIELASNAISDAWITWFVSELPSSSFANTLRELDLSHCTSLTDAGANVLATARSLSKLTTLNLKGVPLSAASISMLRNRFGDGLIV